MLFSLIQNPIGYQKIHQQIFQAYICEGDVYMVMDRFDAAEESYSIALELDPSIHRSKPFKVLAAFGILPSSSYLSPPSHTTQMHCVKSVAGLPWLIYFQDYSEMISNIVLSLFRQELQSFRGN